MRGALQSAQYEIPYHYIPTRARRGWSWPYSVEYVLYLEAVVERCQGRVLDVGCGDGRLVAELRAKGMEAYGVDYDATAVRWGKALGLPVEAMDAEATTGPFDTVVLMDVIEHVPYAELRAFMGLAAKKARRVVVTVPTIEHPLTQKHYRHYTPELLRAHMAPFEATEITGILGKRWWWQAVNKLPFESLTPWLFAHAPSGTKRPLHLIAVGEL